MSAEPPPEKPPFLPVLGYVLAFLVILALLAFLASRLFHGL
jgi:hypothetical protein